MTDSKVTEKVADELREQYLRVRILSDGSIAALTDMLYTRAILLGCSRGGYGARFCFTDSAVANRP